MATSTASLAHDNASDANFRAWASFISNLFNAGGWVKESIAGTIDLTTIVAPNTTNQSKGFEVWRTNDGATNWYVKIEYGSGSAAGVPAIWITMGVGVDGSGNITGQASTRTQFTHSSNAGPFNCYGSAGAGRIVFVLATHASTSVGFGINIERALLSNGSEDPDLLLLSAWYNNTSNSVALPRTGGIPPFQAMNSAVPLNTNIDFGGDKGVILWFGQKGGLTNAYTNILGFHSGTIGVEQDFTINHNGSSKAFKSTNAVPKPTSSTYYMLIRYE